MFEAIADTIKKGIPVVITSRVTNGRVLPVYGFKGGGKTLQEAGALFGDNLSPQKARILLLLALQAGIQKPTEIQKPFDRSRGPPQTRRPVQCASAQYGSTSIVSHRPPAP